jgi:Protein of unknown function (DUF2637)
VSLYSLLWADGVALPCHEKNDRVAAFGPAVNAYLPPSARRRFRIAGLIAAIVCVLAIAAGAFVVSYTGVRDMALTAGVSAHYARFYPWIFDAVFVVAAVAALSLRGALRAYAWLAILVILGAVATANAIHAMSIVLPKRPTEATVAAAPWAVLLIGFTLLYAMARQGLLPTRRAAAAASPTSNGHAENGGPATQVPLSALLADKPATRPEQAQAALTARAATATATRPGPPAKTEPVPPKTEPVTAKTEPTAPKTEPIAKAESLVTTTRPATPKAEPVPVKTEPVTTEPATVAKAEPVAAEPVTTEPVAAEPATADPVSDEPGAAGPVTTEPATVARPEPVSTELTSAGPTSGETEPVTPVLPADPEPAASPAAAYPARTQQFAVRHPPAIARPPTEPGRPFAGPELPAWQPVERDDPSDADAEPVEPTMHFNRLRSGPTPPDEDS